jgi:hypothetical protein
MKSHIARSGEQVGCSSTTLDIFAKLVQYAFAFKEKINTLLTFGF